MEKITLLIDGNFFIQRLRSSEDLTFFENPEKDKVKLIKRATESLCYELNNIGVSVDNVIIAKDFSSWRKKVEQVYPSTSIKEKEKEDYKSNRSGEKDYDTEKFFEAYDYWLDLMKTNIEIQTIRKYGAEADDIVYVVSRAITTKDKKHLVLAWSSDGDYYHLVNDDVSLIKLPKKELYVLKKTVDTDKPKTLSDIFKKKDLTKQTQINESFKSSSAVHEINPIKSILYKIISGDKKDNVPALWYWFTNDRTYKPSDSHIKKAFLLMPEYDLENIDRDKLYDNSFLKKLLLNMFFTTKQYARFETFDKKDKTLSQAVMLPRLHSNYVDGIVNDEAPLTEYELEIISILTHTELVFVSNRKMKFLDFAEIPKEVAKDIIDEFIAGRSQAKMQLLSDSKIALQTMNLKPASETPAYISMMEKTSGILTEKPKENENVEVDILELENFDDIISEQLLNQ